MKKTLLATSALVGGSLLASSAMAEITVGAFGQVNMGFGEVSGTSSQAIGTDFEIHFSGSKDIAIGTAGFSAELEVQERQNDGGNNGFDEFNISLAGGWGKLVLGNQDGAAAAFGGLMTNGTAASGDYVGMVNGRNATAAASATSDITSGINAYGGDEAKITYMTPSMGGFQAGASYYNSNGATTTSTTTTTTYYDVTGDTTVADQGTGAGTASDDLTDADAAALTAALIGNTYDISTTTTTTTEYGHGISIAGKFNQDMGAANVTLAAAYAMDKDLAEGSAADRSGYQLGLNVGMAGFSVAAGYLSDETDDAVAGTLSGSEKSAFNIGLGYTFGDTSVGVLYENSTVDSNVLLAPDVDTSVIGIGASHNLGEGVSVTFGASTGEEDDGIDGNEDDIKSVAVELKTSW